MVILALEGLARRAQRGCQVEVRSATDEVGYDDLRALALDQAVYVREVFDIHRLSEVAVPEALAAFEDEHARLLAGTGIELGEAPGRDRSTEPRPDDADVNALGHQLKYPFFVRSWLRGTPYEKSSWPCGAVPGWPITA